MHALPSKLRCRFSRLPTDRLRIAAPHLFAPRAYRVVETPTGAVNATTTAHASANAAARNLCRVKKPAIATLHCCGASVNAGVARVLLHRSDIALHTKGEQR
jgi:hypothetical protein